MKLLINYTKITLIAAFLFCSISISAQAQSSNYEKIQAAFTAFMTNKLKLTPDESADFWPIYNDYREQLKGIKKEKKSLDNNSNLSDEKKLNKQMDLQSMETNLINECKKKLKEVIPVKKVAALDGIERDFKKWLLEQRDR